MTLLPVPAASVGISARSTCSGIPITIGAAAVAGSAYSWSPAAGLSSSTVANPIVTLINTGAAPTTTTYTLTETNASGCQATNTVAVTVNPAVTAGTISASQTVCSGTAPAPFTGTTGVGSGPNTYTYQWESSPDNSTWTAIAGATDPGYAPGPVNAATYYRRQATATCGTAYSNVVAVQLQPLLVSGVALATPPAQCAGTAFTFAPSPTNAGAAPTYRWFVNGVLAATSPTFSSTTLRDGDQVQVELSPTVGFCASGPATATVTISLTPVAQPAVTMTLQTTLPVCAGVPVTFSLDKATNPGPSPQYQWQVDGKDVAGATTPVFTSSTLRDGQTVTLLLRAATVCGPVTAAASGVRVSISPVVHVVAGPDKTIMEGDQVELEGQADGNYPVTWSPLAGLTFGNNPLRPTASPVITTTYTLSAGTGSCADSSPVTVTVTPRVRIPTAISPNGDGHDDTWEIDNIGSYSGNHVLVFNRWGSKIFEASGYSHAAEWNGTIGGQPAPLALIITSLRSATARRIVAL
ncbi:gliding motility-associated C-terminal domain-containing protein [Hymenobacter sp. BRD128]|uniref:gliding motility-associated C-terminal domain-containing protein n=1 Tax=Hymenobacter sp. BRD128 TaxID=2675878 RepID=UPI0015641CA6|nr:gliding motility-associated C-terminal domain-containing protein [Hymenobacter sp. BRD128]QKG55477.1 gliding motility-associated C-terminal domain-containing protein [Hymenobacter sp. BRD128]